MFEELRLLGDTERSIVVETRTGRRIPNGIAAEPAEREQRIFKKVVAGFREPIEVRRHPGGGFNCAGHVWASRRTSLFDETSWGEILKDDGYRRLDFGVARQDSVYIGDIVVYVDLEAEKVVHVAEIVERRSVGGNESKPWVLSKLNSALGEVVHAVDDISYLTKNFSIRTEYWTERPPGALDSYLSLP